MFKDGVRELTKHLWMFKLGFKFVSLKYTEASPKKCNFEGKDDSSRTECSHPKVHLCILHTKVFGLNLRH
jgi:hypothetical protein